MAVVNQYETPADPSEVAEAGIHPPEPTVALSKGSHEEHQDRDHERGLDLVFEVPLVAFIAFAAADELMDVIRKTLK